MEENPPQEHAQQQAQHVVGPGYPPQPRPRTLEEACAWPQRTKRSRESPSAACKSPDANHDAKRRHTSDTRDSAEATASTATNGPATGMVLVNETAATIAKTADAAAESASEEERRAAAEAVQRYTEFRIRALHTHRARDVTAAVAAAEEETSTTRTSWDGASTWDLVSTETSTLDASKGIASTRQMSPGSARHGAAARIATNEGVNVPEPHPRTYADWLALLSSGRRLSSVLADSEPDSDCYALPKSMWPREHKSAPFRDPSWQREFNRAGTYMSDDPHGLGPEATAFYKGLLERERPLPQNSLFDDMIIGETCDRIRYKNEATLFRDVTPLIAPSVELLAGDHPHLGFLCESTDEVWSSAQPVIRIQPQPSYSVGFSAEAFTEEQFNKATDFFDDLCTSETSPMMGTSDMFFPCFSLEIGPIALGERQNVHNMTVAMRGVVELFRGVCRESELHRQILGFSIAHNHCQVEISVHYPVIYGDLTNFHRRMIHSFDFSDPKCDRWAAYRFTRNLYDAWMPAHFSRICSAIADLPLEWPDGVDTVRDIENWVMQTR